MHLYPKAKKYLSILMAALILFSMSMPAAAQEGDPVEQPAAKLYIRATGTDNYTQSLTVTGSASVELFYGTSADAEDWTQITDSSLLTWNGLVSSCNEDGSFLIESSAAETYTIVHTETQDSVSVTFEIPAQDPAPEALSGDTGRLRARIVDTAQLLDSLSADQAVSVVFYYGASTEARDEEKVTGTGALNNDGIAMEYKGTVGNETDVWEIGFPPDVSGGTVTHLPSGASFPVAYTGSNSDNGDNGEQDGPVDPVLLAKVAGEVLFTDNIDVSNGPAQIELFFGTDLNAEEAKLLSLDELELANVQINAVEGESGHWIVDVQEPPRGTITHAASGCRVVVTAQAPDPNAPQVCLFTKFAGTDVYTPALGISPGLQAQLIFYYGAYEAPDAVEIGAPNALQATEGLNLSYDAEAGFWNLSLEDGCSYGEISFQAPDGFTYTFSVDLVDDGGNDGSEEEPQYFYAWNIADGSILTEAELAAGTTLDVVFRYGTESNYVDIPYDSSDLYINGVATLVRVGQPDDSEIQNVCRIGATGEGNGSVVYNGNYGYYEFPITGKAAEGGSDVEEEFTSGTLLAFWDSMDETHAPFELLPDSSSPLFFAVGSRDNYTILTWSDFESGALRTEGVATLEKNLWAGQENLFTLGVSDYGDGAVVYTKDNVKYRFEVVEGKRLYACSANGDILSQIIVDAANPMDVYLRYGTSRNYEIVTYNAAKVVGSGVISVSASEHEDMVKLTASGAGAGTIIYYNPQYGSQSMELRGAKKMLFATWEDGTGYMTSQEYGPYMGSSLKFYLGVPGNAVPITWDALDNGTFAADGVVSLSKSSEQDVFNVTTSEEIGTGVLKYTENGTTYAFPVNCVEEFTGMEPRLMVKDAEGNQLDWFSITKGEPMTLTFWFGRDISNAVQLKHTDVYSTGGVAVLTPVEGSAHDEFQLDVSGNGQGCIYFEVDGVTYGMSFYGQENMGPGGPGPGGPSLNSVKVDYEGKEITVFLGMLQTQTMNIVHSFGDWYNDTHTHDFHFEFILGALQDFASTKETPAPQSFFDCIKDVRFYVSEWANEDGSTDVPNWSLTDTELFNTGGTGNLSGVNTWRATLSAPNGHGFSCTLALEFTLELPGQDPQTYTLYSGGAYQQIPELHIYANDPSNPDTYLDTADKLNSVLSSREELEKWLEINFPDQFSAYGVAETLTLYLPAVAYDKVIVLNCPMSNGYGGAPSVNLVGAGDFGNPDTQMPGFLNKGGHGDIRNIHFKGKAGQTITYNNSTFTCGVLIDGPTTGWNDMIGVHGCVFEDLDYGIYDTPTGYHGMTSGCKFINCEYGLYIDCKNKPMSSGGANDEHAGNTFINCKFAVWVKSLPEYITPYMLRIIDNTFLNNHKDIKVTTPGRHYYYFYRNYYYGTYNEVSPYSNRMEGRAAAVEIADGSEAVVLTSPSRRYQNDSETLWMFENSTGILNDQAGSLQIAQEALSDLTEQKEISIIDNASTGETVAVWTFGTEGGSAE